MPARRRFSCEDRTWASTHNYEPLYVPGTSTDSCEEFPNPKLLRPMHSRLRNKLRPFMSLLEYGGIRYVFLLKYNNEIADCKENILLEKVHKVVENGDKDCLKELRKECLGLFWPYLKADYEAQRGKPVDLQRSVHWTKKKARNIRVMTRDGVLQAVGHTHVLRISEVEPIKHQYRHLALFSKDEIEELEPLWPSVKWTTVFKIRIKGTEYCLKKLPLGTLDFASQSQISREYRLLQKIPRHRNLSELVGVRDAGEGKIDGLILRYIDGKPLSKVVQATASQKSKWKRQISEAIRFLHDRDIVWGDAKPGNILIEEKNKNAVVIDLGGGATSGWVDLELVETKEGDLQALSRILDFIDNL